MTRAQRTMLAGAWLLVTLPAIGAAQISIVGSMTHTLNAEPGAVESRSIVLRNEGEVAQTVGLYQTDYQFRADGSVFYDEAGSHTRSNAEWISLPAAQVTVPAGGQVPVSYAVRVPERGDLSGTYWSIIMVESELGAPSDGSGAALGVRHLMRFAVQVINEFDGGEGMLAVTAASLERTESGPALALSVANTGTRVLRPQVELELYARDGSVVGPLAGPAKRLYPGSSARFVVPLDSVPGGEYRALALLDAGDADLFVAQYTLELE